MTGVAFYIELHRHGALIFMAVVTAEAGHFAIPETFAGREHAVLVPVHIHFADGLCRVPLKEVE
jgi:hypothetical protein